jgi:hypothetical protein
MSTKASRSVAVASCATQQEAEFLKNLLEANGVKSVLSADDYAGLPLLTSGGVHLLVLEEEAAFAKEVLEEAHS